MKAMIAAIVGLLLAGHVSKAEAQAEAHCATPKSLTLNQIKKCIGEWKTPKTSLPAFNDKILKNYSHKDITDIYDAIAELQRAKDAEADGAKTAAKAAEDAAKAAEDAAKAATAKDEATKKKEAEAATAKDAAKAAEDAAKAAEDAAKAAATATALLKAADARLGLTAIALTDNHCDQDLVLCLDRDGKIYSDGENTTPFLLPRDELVVLVLSNDPKDANTVTLTVSNVRRIATLLPKQSSRQPESHGAVPPSVVKQVKAIVADDSAHLEILCGLEGNFLRYRIPIESRRHYIEFGLMLPFAYQREVTPQGAVKYGMEPDLAFTITVFPGARSSSEPWQSRKRSWFGLMAGADLTNEVRDKRYYLGLDFSPVSGLALNAGLAILPWEYVPNPEQVPDVLTGDIEPDRRYRPSFFFGARMTPEVFDTVKAAYQSLQGQ